MVVGATPKGVLAGGSATANTRGERGLFRAGIVGAPVCGWLGKWVAGWLLVGGWLGWVGARLWGCVAPCGAYYFPSQPPVISVSPILPQMSNFYPVRVGGAGRAERWDGVTVDT